MDPATDLLSAFDRGEIPLLIREANGRLLTAADLPRALLCGSFDPLHAAHRRLADVAAARLAVPVAFELCAVNADKPPLTAAELMRRVGEVGGAGRGGGGRGGGVSGGGEGFSPGGVGVRA